MIEGPDDALSPAVIWDLDGTLAHLELSPDAFDRWKAQIASRLAPHGWSGSLDPLLPALDRALDEVCAELDDAEADRLRRSIYRDLDEWEAEALERVTVIEPLVDLAIAWTGRGVPMVLVTDNGPPATRRALAAIDSHARNGGAPSPRFAAVLVRSPLVRPKPSPHALMLAWEAIRATARRPTTDLLAVGDRRVDREAARALDAVVEVLVWPLTAREGLLDWPVDDPSGTRDTALFLLRKLGLPS